VLVLTVRCTSCLYPWLFKETLTFIACKVALKRCVVVLVLLLATI